MEPNKRGDFCTSKQWGFPTSFATMLPVFSCKWAVWLPRTTKHERARPLYKGAHDALRVSKDFLKVRMKILLRYVFYLSSTLLILICFLSGAPSLVASQGGLKSSIGDPRLVPNITIPAICKDGERYNRRCRCCKTGMNHTIQVNRCNDALIGLLIVPYCSLESTSSVNNLLPLFSFCLANN